MTENQPIVSLDQVEYLGHSLNRPESVHTDGNGALFVSHKGGGVMRIGNDGVQNLIGHDGQLANGHELVPNGFARLKTGSFRLANIGEGGGVWTLDGISGDLSPFVMEADGQFLAAANFVMVDSVGRTWMSISTISQPRFAAYSENVSDGLIVLHDSKGTRIVADGLGFANECRLSPDGKHLVVAETFQRRVSQFDVSETGDLSNRRTFAQFGRGDFPDGCRYDRDGHLWMTSIVSNRLYRIAPDGRPALVIEDLNTDHVEWVENALEQGKMGREHFYTSGGQKLHNIASVTFGGDDGRRVYLGSLIDTKIATFELPDQLAHKQRQGIRK